MNPIPEEYLPLSLWVNRLVVELGQPRTEANHINKNYECANVRTIGYASHSYIVRIVSTLHRCTRACLSYFNFLLAAWDA